VRAEEALAQELVDRARSDGVELVGPGGLLTGLTKSVLETALEAEMEDHLGYPKHAPEGRNGERDILGLRVGDGSEGAKYCHQVLAEILNRDAPDVLIVVCDGLRGLPVAIADIWPKAIVQTCVLHLIRNTFRYASRADWDELACDLRPVYTAATGQAAKDRFGELAGKWGERYHATIETLHARFRRSVRARGHFPNEQAALKCLYLTISSLDPSGTGRARWITRWKAA
jgi:transposase-like protein